MKTYTLTNSTGINITILDYGAIIQSVRLPDSTELVLGFKKIEDYLNNPAYFGAIIGPIANRIAGGKFICENKTYQLECNENNQTTLHSGHNGLHQVYWQMMPLKEDNAVQLSYFYSDGEAGFPGNIEFKIVYQLTDHNEIIINYFATTDQKTPIDLTNHTYWNLNGTGSILNHFAKFYANHYLPVDDLMIPTGEILSVKNTGLDFLKQKQIGKDIQQLIKTKGYDHYFVLDDSNDNAKLAAKISNENESIQLNIYTDQPGFQFYTGNFLKNAYSGFCVETQGYPNAINQTKFPSPWFNSDEIYRQKTIYSIKLI